MCPKKFDIRGCLNWMICTTLDPDRRNMTISVTIIGIALAVIILAFLSFGETGHTSEADTIHLLAMIHRHGARTIGQSYPNDPHINFTWPGGYGFLTKTGSLELYNLGKNLRPRYHRLLPTDGLYTPDNMKVQSSAAERCLMSSQSFLAGFAPPHNNDNMLPIQWQPIAISSVPRDFDNLIAQKKACPKYDRLLAQMYTANMTNDLKAIHEKYAETFAYLSKHAGANMSNLDSIERLYITLSIQKEHGLELPAWTDTVFPEPLKLLAARHLAVLTETPYMQRIKAGPIITEIMDIMKEKKSKQLKPNRSIFIYSGHDVTLVNIMRALDIIEQTAIKPQYAATLAFEIHYNAYLNDMEVKIVYYGSSEEKTPKVVAIPNCDAPCTIEQFEESIEHLIIRDFEADCRLDE